MATTADDKKDLELYYRIAKKYAIELPDQIDRVKAFKWISKISTAKASLKLQTHAIFLLIHSLARKRLVGPFEQMPKDEQNFQHYKMSLQPADISKLLIQKEFEKAGTPLISLEISGDLCELVAHQMIPSFGEHFYYAYSPEKLGAWHNTNQEIVPKGLLNLTIISKPNLSILHESIEMETSQRSNRRIRGASEPRLEKTISEFVDVSVIDPESSKVKDGFVFEQPIANITLRMDALKLADSSGVVHSDDVIPQRDLMPEGEKMRSPHMERVVIGNHDQTNAKIVSGKGIDDLERATEGYDEAFEKAKEDMLSRLPAKLRERLTKKFIPKDLRKYPGRDKNVARTPEIFRKGARAPFRKWKPEEFGLMKTEQFQPAYDVFTPTFDYQPPSHKRLSPMAPLIERPRPKPTLMGFEVDDQGKVEDRRFSEDVEKSWERSMQKRLEKRTSGHASTNSSRILPSPPLIPASMSARRKCMLERLQRLKQREPRRLVFDDTNVDVEPEETVFERFVYQELPEESGNVTISILAEEDMPTDDFFGYENICNISALPKLKDIKELEAAEILLESELQTDDIFAEDQILDPKLAFRDLAVSRQRVIIPSSVSDPVIETSTIGRRTLSVPGHKPIVQEYMEENNTSPCTPPSQPLGPWASKLQRDIARIEQGEEPSIEYTSTAASILSEGQMNTGDMFGSLNVCTPSPIVAGRRRKQAEQMDLIRRGHVDVMARRHARPQRPLVNQDFLEPFYNESLDEQQHDLLLNTSFDRCDLDTPLIGAPSTPLQRNVLQEFEKQMDESMRQYTQESANMSHRLMYDSDFLERRIQELPEDNSIIEDVDLCYEDVFGDVEEPIPIRDLPMPEIVHPKPITYSHLHTVGQKRHRKQSDFPTEYLDEQSFPDESFYELSEIPEGTEGNVEDIESPELVSGVDSNIVSLSIQRELGDSMLQSNEMQTSDMFSPSAIASPPRQRKISPTKIALAKSVQQSMRVDDLKNRLRRMQGLSPMAPKENLNINRILEEDDLLDAVADISFREPQQTLMDYSFPHEGLAAPLIGSLRTPPKTDPFSAFEEEMRQEELAKQPAGVSTQKDSFLADDEMEDMFKDSMIAEPIPIRQIPMPDSRTFIPQRPHQLQHSHLFRPSRPSPTPLTDKVPMARLCEVTPPSFGESSVNIDTTFYDTLNIPNLSERLANVRNFEHLESFEMDTSNLFGSTGRPSPNFVISDNMKNIRDRFNAIRNKRKTSASAEHNKNSTEEIGEELEQSYAPTADPFASFERQMVAELQVTPKTPERSFLYDDEMSDFCPEVASPPNIHTIPMPVIQQLPRPIKPVTFSHLYRVNKPERKKLEDNVTLERLDDCSFPQAESFEGSFIPMGFEEQLADQDQPSELASGVKSSILSSQRSFGDSILQEVDMFTDDLFGQSPVSPPNWPRKSIARITLEETIRQSKKIHDLKNKIRQKKGLPPIPADLSPERVQYLQSMVQQIEADFEESTSDHGSDRHATDPFASFEQNMNNCMQQHAVRQMFGDPNDILQDEEMESLGELQDVCSPPRVKTIPMPCPSKRSTPPHIAQSPTRSPQYLYDISVPDEMDECIADVSPYDWGHPDYDNQQQLASSDFMNQSRQSSHNEYNDEGDEQLEQVSYSHNPLLEPGIDVEAHCERIGLSPTRAAICRSLKSTHDTIALMEKFHAFKQTPRTTFFDPNLPHLFRYLAEGNRLPVIFEESVEVPKEPNLIASFERLYEENPEMFYSNLSKDPSILHDDDMSEYFYGENICDSNIIWDIPPQSTSAVQTQMSSNTRNNWLEDETMPSELAESAMVQNQVCESMLDDEDIPIGFFDKTPSYRASTGRPSVAATPHRGSGSPQTPSIKVDSPIFEVSAPSYYTLEDSIGPVQWPEDVAKRRFEALNVQEESLRNITPPSFASSAGDFIPVAEYTSLNALSPPSQWPTTPCIPVERTQRKLNMEERFRQIGQQRERLPLDIPPEERIRRLIAQQPRVEVKPLPRRTGFSPLRFETNVIEKELSLLEQESFPDEGIPFEDLFDVQLGDLARALYIPTEAEEGEIAAIAQRNVTPPRGTPQQRPAFLPDASPIGETNVMAHEKGFKWLDNFIPMKDQFGKIPQKRPPQKVPRVATLLTRRAMPAQASPNAPTPNPPRCKPFRARLAPKRHTSQAEQKMNPIKATSELDILHKKLPGKEILRKKARMQITHSPSTIQSQSDRLQMFPQESRPPPIPRPGAAQIETRAPVVCLSSNRQAPVPLQPPAPPTDRKTVVRKITPGLIRGRTAKVDKSAIAQQSDAMTGRASMIKVNQTQMRGPGGLKQTESVIGTRKGPRTRH